MRQAVSRLMLALCLALAGLSAGHAQTNGSVTAETLDYEQWGGLAQLAEAVLDRGTASTALINSRRVDLVRWRTRFLAAETANTARIEAIQSQIAALGPPPAEGDTEPAAIAARRATLNDTLAQEEAPRLQATAAFNRASSLIAQIDRLLLERQTEALLEIEPTPLNPVTWATTLSSLVDLYRSQHAQTGARLGDADVREGMRDNAPTLLAMILIGLALVVRGRLLVARLGDRFLDADKRRGRIAAGFVVSLGQLALPVAGMVLIDAAFELSGALTQTAKALADAILVLIVMTYAALWLAGRLFPKHEERAALLDVELSRRARARRTILWIGLFTGLVHVAEVVAALDLMPPATRGVLVLPVYLGLAWMLWSFSRLLRAAVDAVPDRDGSNFGQRLAAICVRALKVVAVAGIALTVVGYLNAAEALIIPTSASLLVIGVLLALQPVVRDLYSVLFRVPFETAQAALIPVLVDFVLVLVAMPILAMVWGVRAERLGEFYSRLLEGFTVGDTRITPGILLAVVLVFAAGVLLTRILQSALKSTVLPRTSMDVGARNAVTSGVGYVGIALACVIAVTSAGIDLTALGFVVGALSVGIGFGLQNVVSNFVSGIILLIERPISEGDWIEVAGNQGFVRNISVRSTTIETFDKTDVIVPNADFISGTVTNWTRGNTVGRILINVGVAYGTDTRRVSAILQEIADGHPDVSTVPPPGVDFMGFGADSLDFRVRCILRDILLMVPTKTEIHHQIAERFAAEGIEIPFAQRDIWLRNPEALMPPKLPDTKDT